LRVRVDAGGDTETGVAETGTKFCKYSMVSDFPGVTGMSTSSSADLRGGIVEIVDMYES